MAPLSAKPDPLELFYSYSHKDKKLRDKLNNHLALLQRQSFITEWNDRMIEAGDDWENEISEHLESSHIILLLVSDDFIASDYCYSVEMNRALERHGQEEARVIPVILRPVDWESSPLGKLQALPEGGKPVTLWRNRDEALRTVAKGIRKVVRSFRPKGKSQFASSPIPRRPVYGFVARRDDAGRDIVARLKEELAPGRDQLVTLSGPGGIGKSTLAAEAARSLQEAYGHRVVWSSAEGRTDFTLLSLLDDIAIQLGRAGLRTLAPAEKEEQVRALAAGALVVLDNYETVAGAERARIEAWFKRTQCSTLFTSRPRVPDTVFVPVSAMSPEEAAEFLEKLTAQTQDPQLFTLEVRERVYKTAEANPFVMQWVVAQIDEAQEPDAVLKELAGGEGDAAERVFARSFNLPQLGDDGRATLLALSLFAPSASREALAALAGLGEDRERLDEAVKRLHALWLVQGVDGNRRLAVEGLTRTLARACLSKDPRADEFRGRFVAYFLHYTVARREPTPENYDTLEVEKENLLGAAEAAFTSHDWESVVLMASVLTNAATNASGVLTIRGYWDEAVRLGEQAVQAARSTQDEAAVANLYLSLAMLYRNRGDDAEAQRLHAEGLEIQKKLGDQQGIALTMWGLGNLSLKQGDVARAKGLYYEALETFRKLGDEPNAAGILHQLGVVARRQGEQAEARRLFNETLEMMKKLGKQHVVANVLHNLAALAQENGDVAEARRLYTESLTISRKFGSQKAIAGTVNNLAMLAENEDDRAEAARLYREALKILEKLGSPDTKKVRESLARVEG